MSEQMIAGGFDLSQVLAQANKVEADAKEGSGGKEKLIYPQNGTLKVKLLFNPKSQVVIRKFERHTIGDNKITCLTNYGQECPVCKILSDIENAKGLDLWKLKRTSRGIAYAEYIEDNYRWDDPKNKPQPGEVIILMFPWTIYQDLNRLMASAGPNLGKLVATNEGLIVNIERYVQNNQTKYTANIDAFIQNHKTRETDDEYNQLLMNLDSLNDKFVPLEINDGIIAKAKEAADQLSREYLNPVPQPVADTASTANMMANIAAVNPALAQTVAQPAAQPTQPVTQPAPAVPVSNPNYYRDPNTGIEYDLINNQWVPRNIPTPPQLGGIPTAVPSTPVTAVPSTPVTAVPSTPVTAVPQSTPGASDTPVCFGQHGHDANKCLLCFKEAECAALKQW